MNKFLSSIGLIFLLTVNQKSIAKEALAIGAATTGICLAGYAASSIASVMSLDDLERVSPNVLTQISFLSGSIGAVLGIPVALKSACMISVIARAGGENLVEYQDIMPRVLALTGITTLMSVVGAKLFSRLMCGSKSEDRHCFRPVVSFCFNYSIFSATMITGSGLLSLWTAAKRAEIL